MKLLRTFRATLVAVGILVTSVASAQDGDAALLLIKNVTVFDGVSERVTANSSVLISGNKILSVGTDAEPADDAVVIDGGGGFLMPGLIDGHTHLSIIAAPDELHNMSWDEIGPRMGVRATDTLMRGFTSVRDLGGPTMGLKKAVDDGYIAGPRIYPSGALISQTSGHGDFRPAGVRHPLFTGDSTNMERLGYYRIVDGPDAVLAAVRENLRNGATQIKLMGSGGVGSHFDPIDSVQFTPAEIRAAVQAVSDWDTYTGSHLHNVAAIRRALENGVRSIDHASEFDEDTMQLLMEKGAYLNPQYGWNFMIEHADFLTENQLAKGRWVVTNSANVAKLANRYKAPVTYNVDSFGNTELWTGLHVAEFSERAKHYSNIQILRQLTSVTSGLLAMSGNRNPYPGKLGVIEKGAYADIIIVNGNPLEDITILADPENNLSVIIKDGTVFKNTL